MWQNPLRRIRTKDKKFGHKKKFQKRYIGVKSYGIYIPYSIQNRADSNNYRFSRVSFWRPAFRLMGVAYYMENGNEHYVGPIPRSTLLEKLGVKRPWELKSEIEILGIEEYLNKEIVNPRTNLNGGEYQTQR